MNENPEQIGRYLDYLFTFGPGLVYVTLLRQRIGLEHERDRLAALRLHDEAAVS